MTALPEFKGWTVDARLRQFRREDEQYGMQYVEFSSRTGRRLRREMAKDASAALEGVKLRLLEKAQDSFVEAEEFRRRPVPDDDDIARADARFEQLTRMECRTETYYEAAALVEEEQANYVLDPPARKRKAAPGKPAPAAGHDTDDELARLGERLNRALRGETDE